MIINYKAWLGALALFLIVGVLTMTFAFKASVNKDDQSTNKMFASQWYTLTLTAGNPNLPANQQLSGTIGEQPTGEDCNIDNEGNPCAVQLSFSGTPPSFPPGTTVQSAISAGGTVVSYTRKP